MADAKITELTAIDAVAADDLLAIVDDPAGTPVTKKATASQIKDYILGLANTWTAKQTIALGTITTSQPVAITQTWNDGAVSFDALNITVTNTASAITSYLLRATVSGTDILLLRRDGRADFSGSVRVNSGSLSLVSNSGGLYYGANFDAVLTRRAAANLRLGDTDATNDPVTPAVAQTLSVQSVATNANNTNRPGKDFTITGSQGTGSGAGGSIIFQVAPAGSSGTSQNALQTVLQITGNGGLTGQDGATANTLALRNGTNAQAFRVYNTYTDASNYERLMSGFSSNIAYVDVVAAGTGTQRNFEIRRGGVTHFQFQSGQIFAGIKMAFASGQQAVWSDGTDFNRGLVGVSGVKALKVTDGSTAGGALQFQEMTAPAAPATNLCYLFAEDNGSGKTRIVARFATGADVVIATEA